MNDECKYMGGKNRFGLYIMVLFLLMNTCDSDSYHHTKIEKELKELKEQISTLTH